MLQHNLSNPSPGIIMRTFPFCIGSCRECRAVLRRHSTRAAIYWNCLRYKLYMNWHPLARASGSNRCRRWYPCHPGQQHTHIHATPHTSYIYCTPTNNNDDHTNKSRIEYWPRASSKFIVSTFTINDSIVRASFLFSRAVRFCMLRGCLVLAFGERFIFVTDSHTCADLGEHTHKKHPRMLSHSQFYVRLVNYPTDELAVLVHSIVAGIAW